MALLCLGDRRAAAAPIRPLARGTSIGHRCSPEKKKKKKKKEKKELVLMFLGLYMVNESETKYLGENFMFISIGKFLPFKNILPYSK